MSLEGNSLHLHFDATDWLSIFIQRCLKHFRTRSGLARTQEVLKGDMEPQTKHFLELAN